ncbi:MAG: efflux RND transporter permease subunit, partial [Spirochaetaceae bacterium]|nr:efflux RND transporter permease subunit [Spirochaetaceae bacterium]
MKNVIEQCVRHPVTVIMCLCALLLAGGAAVSVLPINSLPEIFFPRVTVETSYYGMGAEEIRSSITIPIEDILSTVKGLERIRSVSRDSSSIIILDFAWGVNPAQAAVYVREAVDSVYTTLPHGASKPTVVYGGSTDEAYAIIAIASKKGDSFFERNFCEYEFRNRLRRMNNVGNIVLSGGDKKEIQIIA